MKDLLIKILANQAVIYKKVAILENRSIALFQSNRPAASFSDELNQASDEIVVHLKQLLEEQGQ